MADNAEGLQDLLRQIEELKVSMLEPSEYLDVDARAILGRPVEGFRTFVIPAISPSGAASDIDFDFYFDSKLMDLNAQLERAVKGGFKQYVDAGSVSKNLNNIKSSLDQAIRDMTVRSVSQSFGTAES